MLLGLHPTMFRCTVNLVLEWLLEWSAEDQYPPWQEYCNFLFCSKKVIVTFLNLGPTNVSWYLTIRVQVGLLHIILCSEKPICTLFPGDAISFLRILHFTFSITLKVCLHIWRRLVIWLWYSVLLACIIVAHLDFSDSYPRMRTTYRQNAQL